MPLRPGYDSIYCDPQDPNPTAEAAPPAPRAVQKFNVEILVRNDGWILCSPEVAAFLMQVADSLLNQKAYEAQLAADAKPRIVLAS